MKAKIITFLISSVVATTVLATLQFPFPGWRVVIDKTPDIVIARWHRTPPVQIRLDALIDSEGEITAVLKGANKIGTTHLRLSDEILLREGESYLIFGFQSENNMVQASESYRVIPLGTRFTPELIRSKTLDEKIDFLFRYRLEVISNQVAQLNDEKNRLETGLQKPRSQ